jgi:hypothetical protein
MGRKSALAAAATVAILGLGLWYATEEASPSAGAAQPKNQSAVPVTVTAV